MDTKPILGLIEPVSFVLADGSTKTVLAKIDTGADSSSVDLKLAKEFGLGPVLRTKKVISSHGRSVRPVVSGTIIIGGQKRTEQFTLFDRSHMNYSVLIGKNILMTGFLIDPSIVPPVNSDIEGRESRK